PVLWPFHREGRAVLLLCELVGLILDLARAFDALFHFAHAGEVLIQLRLVLGADFAAERLSAIFHAVENADVDLAPAIFEQVVPRERRVDFDRHWRIRRLPGDV